MDVNVSEAAGCRLTCWARSSWNGPQGVPVHDILKDRRFYRNLVQVVHLNSKRRILLYSVYCWGKVQGGSN